MVRVRVRGWLVHHAYESPPMERSSEKCVCVWAHFTNELS